MSASASSESAWTPAVSRLRIAAVTAEMARAVLTSVPPPVEPAAREREVVEAALLRAAARRGAAAPARARGARAPRCGRSAPRPPARARARGAARADGGRARRGDGERGVAQRRPRRCVARPARDGRGRQGRRRPGPGRGRRSAAAGAGGAAGGGAATPWLDSAAPPAAAGSTAAGWARHGSGCGRACTRDDDVRRRWRRLGVGGGSTARPARPQPRTGPGRRSRAGSSRIGAAARRGGLDELGHARRLWAERRRQGPSAGRSAAGGAGSCRSGDSGWLSRSTAAGGSAAGWAGSAGSAGGDSATAVEDGQRRGGRSAAGREPGAPRGRGCGGTRSRAERLHEVVR